MNRKYMILVMLMLPVSLGVLVTVAQPPRGRMHTAVRAGKLDLMPATSQPNSPNEVSIEVEGEHRVIRSNGIPEHKIGTFPNRGNPNRIRAQQYVYRIPAAPETAERITPISGVFGIAVNGVPFDPGAAEFYRGQMGSRWQYEPLSGAIALGIDVSHAHVQPNGAYHYHGLPTQLLEDVRLAPGQHSPIVGWAADGFPIYAVYGFQDPQDPQSPVTRLKSSFRLKSGLRPGSQDPSSGEPGGKYDGTFVADYEFAEGSGDLDECNGRFTVTPEFPEGTYAYFLTENWPVIPRHFRGTPSEDFARRGPGGPPGFGPPGFQPGRRPPPGFDGPGRPPRRRGPNE